MHHHPVGHWLIKDPGVYQTSLVVHRLGHGNANRNKFHDPFVPYPLWLPNPLFHLPDSRCPILDIGNIGDVLNILSFPQLIEIKYLYV